MLASCAILAVVAVKPGYYVRFTDLAGDVSWPYFLLAHFQQLAQAIAPLAIGWWFLRSCRGRGNHNRGLPGLANESDLEAAA
jgi:hypothetical protein